MTLGNKPLAKPAPFREPNFPAAEKGPSPPAKAPKPIPIAALPNGLLTIFLTAFLAFLKTFLIKYEGMPV